jgi:hypothetical protein
MNGVKDRVLDVTERIASFHAASLGPGRAGLSGLLHSRRQCTWGTRQRTSLAHGKLDPDAEVVLAWLRATTAADSR